MDWVMSTKQYRLYYITGLASNNVLNTNPVVVNLSKKVKEDYEKAKQPVKRYSGLMYQPTPGPIISLLPSRQRSRRRVN